MGSGGADLESLQDLKEGVELRFAGIVAKPEAPGSGNLLLPAQVKH